MISRKFLKRAILASVFTVLPLQSFAAHDAEVNYDSDSTFYVKGFYNAGYVGSNDFENSGTSPVHAVGSTAAAGGNVVQGSVTGDYEPDYDFSLLGGGLALGYSYGGMRVELEGILVNDTEISDDSDSNQNGFYATTSVPSNLATQDRYLDGINKVAVGPVKNKKFSYMAGMLNAYYDASVGSSFVPYVGAGVGIAEVTFEGDQKIKSYPIALQGKIGASFDLSMFGSFSMMPYAGYRMLYLMSTEADSSISGLSVLRKQDASTSVTTAVEGINYKMESSYLLHNLEVGLMVPLNA